ncbi:MAG: tetratricopeptide repeat protein [Myxococcota bacterium]
MADPKAQEEGGPEGGRTPGQLLAAKKAAKAAKKAAKRGRQAEVRESEAIRATSAAAEWAIRHRRALWVTIGVLAAALTALVAWSIWDSHRDREATQLMLDAVQVATAPLEDGTDTASDATETFTSVEARATASAEQFQRVIDAYPSSQAAAWARVGRAVTLVHTGEPAAARELLKSVLEDADSTVLRWRALEGVAQSYEAEEQWAEAARQYEAMMELGDPRIALEARYHLARMTLAQGERDQAAKDLGELREALREEDAPDLPYLSQQVDALLGYLDPGSAAPSVGAGGADGQPQLSPEELQKLMRRLEQQRGAGGGGDPE